MFESIQEGLGSALRTLRGKGKLTESNMREGLELVDGPPFDAAGYDWAHRDQDVAEACTLIEVSTKQLVDLTLAKS